MLVSLMISVIGLVFPVMTRRMLNTYIPDRNIRMIVFAALFVLFMYLIRSFFAVFHSVSWPYDGYEDSGPDAA